jgi:hypothetical protein
MSEPLDVTGDRYFVVGLYRGGQRVPVMVWNGVKDYANDVPNGLVGLVASQSTGKIGIVQVGKPVGVKGRSIRKTVDALSFGGVILWARNQKTYRSIVEEFRTYTFANLDMPLSLS